MPTLPMLSPTTHADASRGVTAPGGYEFWRFDATSDDGKLHLVAYLHFGNAFDSRYLRRYRRYRRFPTKVRPPVPAEFCGVTFALLEPGRPALWFASEVPAEEVNAAGDGRSVRVGASHIDRGSDGVLRVHLRGIHHDRTIAANLSFRPQLDANCEIDITPGRNSLASTLAFPHDATAEVTPTASVGDHGWVVVNPLCDVDGEVRMFAGESAEPPRVTPFAGSGCHDHRFGTRPLIDAADRWVSGRALFEDQAILFQQVGDATFACCAGPKQSSPTVLRNTPLKASGSATSRWGIGYPESIELPADRGGDVRLMRPRVVGSSFASVTVAYDAVGELETGQALVQVLKAKRLAWPSR